MNMNLFSEAKHEVFSKKHLFYCPECLKNQIDYYGEGYWNRMHQIPGVFVCTKHQIPLMKHALNFQLLKNLDFVLPTLKDIRDYNKDEKYSIELMHYFLNLADDVEYIFQKNFNSISKDYLFRKYETLLEIREIAYPMLERRKKLNNLLLNYYPKDFLKMLNLYFCSDENSWIGHFNTAKSVYSMHPIKHLLIMRLLCGSVRNFFEKEYKYEPFGKGPWICMNPLADHYLEKCVEKVKISVHQGNRRIQGDMICSCGFIYRLRGGEKSPHEVHYFSNRIMQKGHVWEKQFNKFLSQRLSINEIARRTKLTKPTIRKILRDRNNEKIKEDETSIKEKSMKKKQKLINKSGLT